MLNIIVGWFVGRNIKRAQINDKITDNLITRPVFLNLPLFLRLLKTLPIKPNGKIGLLPDGVEIEPRECVKRKRQNRFLPNRGNKRLRPNNQAKRAHKIVQKPPSEANNVRTTHSKVIT